MSYLQPEQLTATAYVDDALQDYLFQLQHCTTDPAQAPPPNVDLSALSTIQGNGEAVMSQSDMATLDPHAAQAAAAYNQEGLPSFAEQAMQQDQQQQDMGQQASANGKQSAVWVQRNRKNQKQYRIRQKVCMFVHEFSAAQHVAAFVQYYNQVGCRHKSNRWRSRSKRWLPRLRS